VGFLKPADDDSAPIYEEDRPDIQPLSQTTFVYDAHPGQAVDQHRARLPVAAAREQLLYLMEQHQVVVVVGETGSGKSTQIPQFLMEAGYADEVGKMVGVTQPRRVAATTLATRVAQEKQVRLGAAVGYSIRFDECYSRDYTKIKFVTEGILIREMLGDPLLSMYSVLMLDEVHERTASIDIIMGLLKKVMKRRRDLRVIVSSATVDAEYLRDFFNSGKEAKEEGEENEKETNGKSEKDPKVARKAKVVPATILSVEGRNYSVDVYYLSEPCPDYVRACVDTCARLHEQEPPGDVLIFLTGMEEVDHCCTLLKQYSDSAKDSKHGLRLWVLPMYGSLAPTRQLKVFRPVGRGYRKVVVATNIAETSITIDGISYVIDSCFVKQAWFNPDTYCDSLTVTTVSQAGGEQRAGRAGRTRPGRCLRMCREKDFLELPLNTPPELQRTDLCGAVLQLKALGIDNIVRFDFPSAPPSRNLIAALELLSALGAIGDQGELTKPLGEQMSELPIHPTLAKMLLSSAEMGCSQEIVTIIAMLQVENVFTQQPGQADKAKVAKRKFEVEEGDLLTLLNVYYAFHKLGGVEWSKSRHWCTSHFLRYKALKRATELREQLFKVLRRFGMTVVSCTNKEVILKTILMGLFPNAAYLHFDGKYRTVRGDIPLKVHPKSVLYTVKLPEYVVYTEIVHSKDVYMRDITKIDPSWLEECAPHFYEKRRVRRDIIPELF